MVRWTRGLWTLTKPCDIVSTSHWAFFFMFPLPTTLSDDSHHHLRPENSLIKPPELKRSWATKRGRNIGRTGRLRKKSNHRISSLSGNWYFQSTAKALTLDSYIHVSSSPSRWLGRRELPENMVVSRIPQNLLRRNCLGQLWLPLIWYGRLVCSQRRNIG